MRRLRLTTGETTVTWCANCQASTRLRIPIHDQRGHLADLEVCTGCGANHATPRVEMVPAPLTIRHPVAAAANALNRRQCQATGQPAVLCAYGNCQMPGRWACTWKLQADDGSTTYLFCKDAHRESWLTDNGLTVSEAFQ
jgi:hypothetical protein